jgi:hypothetical protein
MIRRLLHNGILAMWTALLLMALLGCSDVRNKVALFLEEPEIRKAAQRYLDAEVRRDLKEAYTCLAPSSTYMTTNPSYENYLREAQTSSSRIIDYKILEISKLRDNHDREKYPRIEKFVQVEVDVIVSFEDNKEAVPVNYSFTFIKEDGKWYKG